MAAIAVLVPCVAGGGTSSPRGKLLPDLPLHLEYARRDVSQGNIGTAMAHLSLILMEEPVRYRIEFVRVPDSMKPTCRLAFEEAVELWQQAFPGEIHFTEVADAASSDLTITFEPDVRQSGNAVAGIVNWKRRVLPSRPAKCQLSAEMHLRIMQPSGRYMQIEHMRHTAAHELGHVLGLDDSPFFGDIMGPLDLARPATGFEVSELENLRTVRLQAQEVKLKVAAMAR